MIFSNDNIIGDEFLAENFDTFNKNSIFFTKYELDITAEGFLGRGTFSICRFVIIINKKTFLKNCLGNVVDVMTAENLL